MPTTLSLYPEKNVLAQVEDKDLRLTIFKDTASPPPMQREGDIGQIMCLRHPGITQIGIEHRYVSIEQIMAHIEKEDPAVVVPVIVNQAWPKELSTITSWMTPLNLPRYFRQIGWAYSTKEEVEKHFPEKKGLEAIRAARARLIHQLEDYNTYLQGDVYRYVVHKTKEDPKTKRKQVIKQLAQGAGFYGTEFETNGMAKHLGHFRYLLNRLPFVLY